MRAHGGTWVHVHDITVEFAPTLYLNTYAFSNPRLHLTQQTKTQQIASCKDQRLDAAYKEIQMRLNAAKSRG